MLFNLRFSKFFWVIFPVGFKVLSMFRTYKSQSSAGFALNISLQIFHATVRSIRQKHSSPIIGLLSEMLQAVMFVAAFWLFFQILGIKSAAIRGDFVIYIMSGIFLFMTHLCNDAARAYEHSHCDQFRSSGFSLFANFINVCHFLSLLCGVFTLCD